MTELKEKTRRDIAEFLPEAIETALESYRSFSMEEATKSDNSNTEDFKKHHDACKVAIAHIKLLIDLAKLANLPDDDVEQKEKQERLAALVSYAQKEIDDKSL